MAIVSACMATPIPARTRVFILHCFMGKSLTAYVVLCMVLYQPSKGYIDLLWMYITFINLWFLLMFGLSSLYNVAR